MNIGDLEDQLKAATELVEKYESRMGEMRNSSRTLVQHYALPPAIDLTGKFVVQNARERDIDLLIRGLDGLSHWPMLGAQQARGAGEISGRAEFRWNDQLLKVVSFGGFQPAEVREIAAAAE